MGRLLLRCYSDLAQAAYKTQEFSAHASQPGIDFLKLSARNTKLGSIFILDLGEC